MEVVVVVVSKSKCISIFIIYLYRHEIKIFFFLFAYNYMNMITNLQKKLRERESGREKKLLFFLGFYIFLWFLFKRSVININNNLYTLHSEHKLSLK